MTDLKNLGLPEYSIFYSLIAILILKLTPGFFFDIHSANDENSRSLSE
jgi:hypothetical protein